MTDDRRLVGWIDLVGDLLQQPRPEFPVAQIGWQLNRTFRVRAVSWDWREHSVHSGFQAWPEVDLGKIAHLPPWTSDGILERHPLLRWFMTTQDPAPQSTGRVPEALAPRQDRQLVDDYLKPLGMEQQLSIPYLLDGASYGTFVLARPEDDYPDEDIELARHLQRLIRGVYLRTVPVAGNRVEAVQACGAADRADLTATELAVLILLADGHTAYGIALRLQMAPRTASKHLEHIYRKLAATDRLAAVFAAREAGVITAGPAPAERLLRRA
jgi:DNA-binding CsgD family transcriptional regulator